MAIEAYEETGLRHPPERLGLQLPGKRDGFHPARQMSSGQLAADAVRLQRLLADAYPELARIQRLEG